jgi:hypothetical protein
MKESSTFARHDTESARAYPWCSPTNNKNYIILCLSAYICQLRLRSALMLLLLSIRLTRYLEASRPILKHDDSISASENSVVSFGTSCSFGTAVSIHHMGCATTKHRIAPGYYVPAGSLSER